MPTPALGLERVFAVDVADAFTVPANEIWVQVAMQQEGDLNRSSNKTDTTNKQDVGFTSEVVTTKTWSGSISGFDSVHNLALRHLASKMDSTANIDAKVHVKLIMETGEEKVGTASLDNFDTSFSTNEGVTYSVSLTGRGPLQTR